MKADAPAPLTHRMSEANSELRHRLCKCSRCGELDVCTASSDFFVEGAPPHTGKPLLCQSCFYARLAEKGIDTMVLSAGSPKASP